MTPEFSVAQESPDDYKRIADWLPSGYTHWHPLQQAQFLETAILLPGYILSSQGDRVAMAHSVEGRFPLLDYRLAEFAARMPPRLKMHGIQEKFLLKRTFADLVPQQVTGRTKQPYRSPDVKSFFTSDWQSVRAAFVSELLSPERLGSAGVFRVDVVDRLLRKIRNGKATGTRDNMALVAILSTQLLVDQFVEHFPSEVNVPTNISVAEPATLPSPVLVSL